MVYTIILLSILAVFVIYLLYLITKVSETQVKHKSIKQLKDGYIKHKKELIERDFNDYQRCSKSN